MTVVRLLLPVVMLTLACGDKEEDAVELPAADCAWLESDNCWAELGAASLSCAPTDPFAGVLGEDMGDCVFPDGTSVSFTPSAADPNDWMEQPTQGFTVYQGDYPCAAYQADDSGFIYTSGSDSFSSEFSGATGTWTCPSGDQYEAGLDILECDSVFERSPGLMTVWNDISVSIYVNGLAEPGGGMADSDTLLFQCTLDGA